MTVIREFSIDEPGVREQLVALVHTHWEEVQQDGSEDFSLNFKMYEGAAKAGILRCVGLFDGEMVGYYSAIFVPSWHTSGVKIAQDLGWFVRKDYRRGRHGVRLVQAMEELARTNGCSDNAISIKILKYPKPAKLLELLGYECSEHRYTKKLKGQDHA